MRGSRRQHAIVRVRRTDNSFRFDRSRRLLRHAAFPPLANTGRTMALLLLFSFPFRHSWVENRYLLTRPRLTEFRSEALLFTLPPPYGHRWFIVPFKRTTMAQCKRPTAARLCNSLFWHYRNEGGGGGISNWKNIHFYIYIKVNFIN